VVEHAPELATILLLAAVSVAAGVVGIAIGVLMYVRHRPDPAAVARAAGPLYRLLVNKYYIDELYDHRIVEAARAIAGASWAFDMTKSAVELAASLWMLTQFKVGEPGFQLVERVNWLPSLGISYLVGVDGISVLLVPMTTLLTFISVLYSRGGAIKTRITEYMTAFLLLEVGMVGVFVALDLFLFYVFFELMLVPMYLIIGIWGGPR